MDTGQMPGPPGPITRLRRSRWKHAVVMTRRSLHAVAERLLAGPQYREHGEIRLRVTAGGFGQFKGPLRVEGVEVVGERGRVAMRGTIGDIEAALVVEAGEPADLYAEHADLGPDEELAVDPAAATLLLDWFALGDQALRQFAPADDPVLWPEHFDLGIAIDEVNYGVSPGDAATHGPTPTWAPGRLARERSGTRRSAPSGLRRNCPTPTQ